MQKYQNLLNLKHPMKRCKKRPLQQLKQIPLINLVLAQTKKRRFQRMSPCKQKVMKLRLQVALPRKRRKRKSTRNHPNIQSIRRRKRELQQMVRESVNQHKTSLKRRKSTNERKAKIKVQTKKLLLEMKKTKLRSSLRIKHHQSSRLLQVEQLQVLGLNWGRGNVQQKKCLLNLEQRQEALQKAVINPTQWRSTVAPSAKRQIQVCHKVPPAPLLLRKVQPLVDPPAVTVKRTGARPSARGITNPVPETGGTIARSRAAPTAAHPGEGRDGAAVAGGIVARPLAADHTPAVRSALLGPAVATATAAAATRRATATTAQRGGGAAVPNAHQTLSMKGGAAEGGDAPEGVSTPPLPLRTRVLAHAATAVARSTGDTTAAAPAAPAAGAAAPAVGPGGAATAAAVVLPAAPRPPIKAPHIVEGAGAELTVTHTAETLTALASIVPSRHGQPPHEALTATHIHPVHRRRDQAAPETQANRRTHLLLDSFWKRSSRRKAQMILP